jgi:flagellar biosynthesis/type III secretory pathway protein FliH
MSEITVHGLNVEQARRFKAVAKELGGASKAARLVFRAGLLVLGGGMLQGTSTESLAKELEEGERQLAAAEAAKAEAIKKAAEEAATKAEPAGEPQPAEA